MLRLSIILAGSIPVTLRASWGNWKAKLKDTATLKDLIMSWKFVMNNDSAFLNRSDLEELALKLGYKFFVFNAEILFVSKLPNGETASFNTGIKASDLY